MAFRLFKPKSMVREIVRGDDGKPVMVKGKLGKLVPKRVPILDADGSKVYRDSPKWYIELSDGHGHRTRVPGFTDKTATQQKAADLQKRLERGESDLIDKFDKHRKRPLTEHLVDWHADKLGDVSKARADGLYSRARRIIEGCRFNLWGDLVPSRVNQFIADLRGEPDNLGITATNQYMQAIKQFAKWMVKDGRAAESPLAHLKGGNPKIDRRRVRRPYTADELIRLMTAAEAGPDLYGVPGRVRALLYRFVAETGVRQSEARTLTPEAVDLDGEPPTATVRAAYSEHRRDDVQPMLPSMAEALRPLLVDVQRGGQVFPIPDDRKQVIRMLRADLEAAGIAYRDEEGHYRDFYALRHTFVTNLALAGTAPKLTMDLARHSDINLTMERYSHTVVGDRARALVGLPDLGRGSDREALQATGTDDVAAAEPKGTKESKRDPGICSGISKSLAAPVPPVSATGQVGSVSDESEGLKKPHKQRGLSACDPPVSATGREADDGIRTHNLSFTKAVLYR